MPTQHRVKRHGRRARIERLDPRQLLAAIAWTGAGDGTHFNDPLNWSPAQVPSFQDDATINAPGAIVLIDDGESVNTLQTNAAVNISGGHLAVYGGTIFLAGGAHLNIGDAAGTLSGYIIYTASAPNGAKLNGAGTITLGRSGSNGIFNSLDNTGGAAAGTLTFGTAIAIVSSGSGQISSSAGNTNIFFGSIAISAGADFALAGTVINAGAISAGAGGSLSIGDDFTNNATGTLVAAGGATITFESSFSNLGAFAENDGTFSFEGTFSRAALGNFARSNGTIQLAAGGTVTGNLALQDGDGPFLLNGGSLIGGTYSATGDGRLVIASGAGGTLDHYVLASNLQVGGSNQTGVLKVTNGLTLQNATLTLGDTSAAGQIIVQQTNLSTGLTIAGAGTITFSGFSGNAIYDNVTGPGLTAAPLTFGPGIVLSAGRGFIYGPNPASTVVFQGSIMEAQAGSQGLSIQAAARIDPGGEADVSAGTLGFTGSIVNQGVFRITGGELRIAPGTQAGIGSVSHTGGILGLTGNITGNLALSDATGDVTLLNTLLQNATYTATGSARLLVQDATFDNVTVAGPLVIGAQGFSGRIFVERALTLANATVSLGDPAGTSSFGTIEFEGSNLPSGLLVAGTGVITTAHNATGEIDNVLADTAQPGQSATTAVTFDAGIAVSGSYLNLIGDAATNSFTFLGTLASIQDGTGVFIQAPVTIGAAATVTSASVITFEAGLTNYDAATGTLAGGTYDIVNGGSIQLPANVAIRTLAASISLQGTDAAILTGLVDHANAFATTLTIAPAASLSIGSGDDLPLGTLINNGSLSITSNASIVAAGAFSNAGTFTFVIDATDGAGSLAATGTATLGGTLILQVGANTPLKDEGFTLLTAGAISGNFAQTQGGVGSDGQALTVTYDATTVKALNGESTGGGGGGGGGGTQVMTASIGGLDASFGGGTGTVTVSVPAAQLSSIDSFLQSDGKVLTAGFDATSGALILTRLNADGSLDGSFGSAGVARTPLPSGFTGRRIAFAPAEGRIYLTGIDAATTKPAAVRFNLDATLDGSFGEGGELIIGPLAAGDLANALLAFPDKAGGFLVAGSMAQPDGTHAAVLFRITTAGSLNTKFGAKGFYARPGNTVDAFNAVALAAKHSIFATGLSSSDNGATSGILTVGLSAGGKPVKAFPASVLHPPGYAVASGQRLSLQPDGKVDITVAVATSATATGSLILRLTTKGLPDATFGASGFSVLIPVPTNAATSSLHLYVPAADSTGAPTGTLTDLFDAAAVTLVQIPGGKVREIAATPQSSGSTALQQTQLIADASNLRAGAIKTAPKPYKPSAKTTFSVAISDTGTLATPTAVPATVYFSTDAVISSNDVKTSIPSVKVSLKPGASKSVAIPVITPAAGGMYFIIVVLNPSDAATPAADLTPTDNTATSTGAVTIAAPTTKGAALLTIPAPTLPAPGILQRLFAADPILA